MMGASKRIMWNAVAKMRPARALPSSKSSISGRSISLRAIRRAKKTLRNSIPSTRRSIGTALRRSVSSKTSLPMMPPRSLTSRMQSVPCAVAAHGRARSSSRSSTPPSRNLRTKKPANFSTRGCESRGYLRVSIPCINSLPKIEIGVINGSKGVSFQK